MDPENIMPKPKEDPLPDAPAPKRRRIYRYVVGLVLFAFVSIQCVPYGRNHTNPPITADVAWDSQRTESLVRGACFDCHSHETHWPWYSHVAPISWLVQSDVDEGREELNFSVGNLHEIHHAAKMIREGEMPPWFYRPLHARARLSSTDEDALLQGLSATFGDPPKRTHKPRRRRDN